MIRRNRGDEKATDARFPGVRMAMDGSEAVVEMETAASEGAGAYPITPSTQMGEGWAAARAAGKTNVNGRRLLFFEPEGEHAAAGVTAGMSMTGLRATNFSSGQGIAYMHESLYAAVGKRLTYVLNMGCRAMTKATLNVHAGHDDYHCVDDTGFFQVFGKNAQTACDEVMAHTATSIAQLYGQLFSTEPADMKIETPSPPRIAPPVLLGQTIALDLKGKWWTRWWQRRRGFRAYAVEFGEMIRAETDPIIRGLKETHCEATQVDARKLLDEFMADQRAILVGLADNVRDGNLSAGEAQAKQQELSLAIANLEKLAA